MDADGADAQGSFALPTRVPSDSALPEPTTQVISKMGEAHRVAALRIQSVFRGHLGRAMIRQHLLDMYAAFDAEEQAVPGEMLPEQAIVVQQGGVVSDAEGVLAPRSDMCVQARQAIRTGQLELAWQYYALAAEAAGAAGEEDLGAEAEEALQALRLALECDEPTWDGRSHVLCGLGQRELAAGQVESAAATLTAALLCDWRSFEARCARAAVWVRLRNYARAVDDAAAAAEMNEADARVHSLEGAARLGLGDMRGARVCFRRGLQIDGRNRFMLSGLEAVESMLAAEDQGDEEEEEEEEEVRQDAGATKLEDAEDAERDRPDAAATHAADAADAAAVSEQAAVQAPAIEAPRAQAQAEAEAEADSERRQSLGAESAESAESAVAGVAGGARADAQQHRAGAAPSPAPLPRPSRPASDASVASAVRVGKPAALAADVVPTRLPDDRPAGRADDGAGDGAAAEAGSEDGASGRAGVEGGRAGSDAQYEELKVAHRRPSDSDASSSRGEMAAAQTADARARPRTPVAPTRAKKTPSPFLAKELQARQEEERQRLLAQTLPAEVGVPLLQGVVRRQAVRVVSRYWHHHRDDCDGRLPHQLQHLPVRPGAVRQAVQGRALAATRTGRDRPGEGNVVVVLGAATRLQAVARAKLSLMLFASGRLWLAETAAHLADGARAGTRRHGARAGGGGGGGGGGGRSGVLHHILVKLLLEDGGMVRKERSTLTQQALGSVARERSGDSTRAPLPHDLLGLLYWQTSTPAVAAATATPLARSSSDAGQLPLVSPVSPMAGAVSPVGAALSPVLGTRERSPFARQVSPEWGSPARADGRHAAALAPSAGLYLGDEAAGWGARRVSAEASLETLREGSAEWQSSLSHTTLTRKSLREQSQELRDTQRRAKLYRVGRPLGPADSDRPSADGPRLLLPGDELGRDKAAVRAEELGEDGALYAITAPQEPRAGAGARAQGRAPRDVPKAMLELAAARRLEAAVRMHLAHRVLAKVMHIRALRFRAALRIQTWMLAIKSRRVARVIREAFVLEGHLQKSAMAIQARMARGPAARRRVALLRRWRKLGLSHADICREHVRYQRGLYVSKGHRHRFRHIAAVLQAAARRKVLMTKYGRYQAKRAQMTDEELLFEDLRLNKVLEKAFWRDFGPADYKRRGATMSHTLITAEDAAKKRGPGQWFLHYARAGSAQWRPETSKTGRTGSEVDYTVPGAVKPHAKLHAKLPLGHDPHVHHPMQHIKAAYASGRVVPLPPEPHPPAARDSLDQEHAALAGSPRRSVFTPRSRPHHAPAPTGPPPRQDKVVFQLPLPRDADDVGKANDAQRSSPQRSPRKDKSQWPPRSADEAVQALDVFKPTETSYLPAIVKPRDPLGGVGSSVRVHTPLADLSVVREASQEQSMAEMEASILSRKSASGAGVISAPLPILSGALRHTVGEFARKLEHVHHEFEHKVGVKQG